MEAEPPDLEFSLPGSAILRLVQGLLAKPNRMDQLREKLLELELAKAMGAGVVAYQAVELDDLAAARRDWVLCGLRGSGKTATAVSLARRMADALGMRAYGVGWSTKAAEAVGLSPVSWASARGLQSAVLVLDEFRLLDVPPSELWRVLALGRQRECATICTAQSTAAITPDVFRIGVSIGWTAVDVVASQFEREELVSVTAAARTILAQLPSPGGLAALCDGAWYGSRVPLPEGWTNEVSRLWSGR